MATDNENTARRIFDEVLTKGRLELLPELAHEDVVIRYGANDRVEGLAAYEQAAWADRGTFADQRVTVEDVFGAGDRVVVRWRWEATHAGPYRGIEPAGRTVSLSGMSIYRFTGGKVAEAWVEADNGALLEQLGVPAAS
jgi:predicted ester cyclase